MVSEFDVPTVCVPIGICSAWGSPAHVSSFDGAQSNLFGSAQYLMAESKDFVFFDELTGKNVKQQPFRFFVSARNR